MDRFILYRVRENGSPAPPMYERIRSARYEKVHDTFSLTVLIETKAPSMSMMKKEIKGFQTAWILFKCQRSRWSWKMKMMLLLVTMTIRTTVMTPEDFGRCRVNDIRKFSSPVSVVIPRITFEFTAEQDGSWLHPLKKDGLSIRNIGKPQVAFLFAILLFMSFRSFWGRYYFAVDLGIITGLLCFYPVAP